MADLLPEFIVSRRWFRAKTRKIAQILIEDVVPFAEQNSWLLMLDIQYADDGHDSYLLPVSTTTHEEWGSGMESAEPFAHLHGETGQKAVLHSAFANPKFRSLILNAVNDNQEFKGRNGTFRARRTDVPSHIAGNLAAALDSFVSRAEQSNTSIIYGDQFILKLFRKVEPGINPDIEVGSFLTEHQFANTPAVLGALEYESTLNGNIYAAGILQKFARNQGDAWRYTLESLSGFFRRALARKDQLPSAPAVHPLELMRQAIPGPVRELIGEYLDSAELLGKRSAEMHLALASGTEPDFAPEPFTSQDAGELYTEMLSQAEKAFSVLHLKEATLAGSDAGAARELLALKDAVRGRFEQLKNSAVDAQRIRFHGDYHLGQVLYTGNDFMIIDFEGEPARPLSERRGKTICLRDVAGMVRSFQYAAYASLFGQVLGLPPGGGAEIEAAAALWYAYCGAAYLKGYFETAGQASFLPPSENERRILLDAFLLHKALYEVAYELNNRPDWVRIPLRGILGLVQ